MGRPPRSREQPEHPTRRPRFHRVHRVQVGPSDRQVRLPLRGRGAIRHRHSRSDPDDSLDPRGAVRQRAWRPIPARSRPCGDLWPVRRRFGGARLRAERRFRHHRLLPAGGGRGSPRADRPADPGRAAPRAGADAERARRGERGVEHLGGVRGTCGPGTGGSHPREWGPGARRPGRGRWVRDFGVGHDTGPHGERHGADGQSASRAGSSGFLAGLGRCPAHARPTPGLESDRYWIPDAEHGPRHADGSAGRAGHHDARVGRTRRRHASRRHGRGRGHRRRLRDGPDRPPAARAGVGAGSGRLRTADPLHRSRANRDRGRRSSDRRRHQQRSPRGVRIHASPEDRARQLSVPASSEPWGA